MIGLHFDVLNMYGKLNNFSNSFYPSSKQVNAQKLPRCCVTSFWTVGPCIVLESIRDASRVSGPALINSLYSVAAAQDTFYLL